MTFLVPKGYYETEDVTYLMNGVEKTRTVIKDGSFQYLTDAAGKPVTEGVALFSGDGGTGFSIICITELSAAPPSKSSHF